MIKNEEMGRMCEERVMIYFKGLSQHLLGGTKKNNEIALVRNSFELNYSRTVHV